MNNEVYLKKDYHGYLNETLL